MHLNFNFFRDRAIVNVDAQSVTVNFTHWERKRKSFSLRWEDVNAIKAVQLEPAIMALVFCTDQELRWSISEDMENWSALLDMVHRNCQGFDWITFEETKGHINKSLLCWKRTG
jgi:hypothetical protein